MTSREDEPLELRAEQLAAVLAKTPQQGWPALLTTALRDTDARAILRCADVPSLVHEQQMSLLRLERRVVELQEIIRVFEPHELL